jgi:hypothetical protein
MPGVNSLGEQPLVCGYAIFERSRVTVLGNLSVLGDL